MKFANLSRRILLRMRRGSCLEELTVEQRRAMWPPAIALGPRHIQNCRMLEDRLKVLEEMPKKSTCAEIGIWRCEFSDKILSITQPTKLHLIDNDRQAIATAHKKFPTEISRGLVEVHHQDSSTMITSLSDETLDWVYVDGDHSYEGVSRDLEAILPKLKPAGFILLNDYIFFGPSDFTKYGVMEALNEFCVKHDFEFVYFALQGRGYFDVVIRQIKNNNPEH